jgi:transcription elongation factor Elf1
MKTTNLNIEKFAQIVGTPRPSTDQENVNCPHCNSSDVWCRKSYAGNEPVITAIACNDCGKFTEPESPAQFINQLST